MREILFRGKAIDNGEWIEGCYLDRNNIGVFFDDTEEKDCEVHIFPVISSTIRQYTGVNDKSGQKIFEGDIIKFGLIPYVVKYDLENARYMLFDKDGYKRDGFNINTMQLKSVIGNIHDNPELLGGEE